jgi:hypothetical protein
MTAETDTKLEHTITITKDWITGDIYVHWGEIQYAEALGMLELAKLLLYQDYEQGDIE